MKDGYIIMLGYVYTWNRHKLNMLLHLSQYIKHHNQPEGSDPDSFKLVRISILVYFSNSTLSHTQKHANSPFQMTGMMVVKPCHATDLN